jgi:hypothetical protein
MPPMPLDLLLSPKLYFTITDHLSVRCPACGRAQDRQRRYFGIASASQVRACLLVFMLLMLGGILWAILRNARQAW